MVYGLSLLVQLVPLGISYLILLYLYRLFLHPLARFPGPKLAAASRWYEFYYDVVLQGQYTFHVQKLHKKYGPIIRVAPDELHVDDPEFFDILYTKSGRTDRFDWANNRFGNASSVFTSGPDSVHRMRRAALNPFFSKRSINQFQDVIRDKVEQLLNNLAKYKDTDKPVTISNGFMALVGDVIMQYCFGHNYNHLDTPNFEGNLHDTFMAASRTGHLAVQFPWLPTVMMALPDSILVKLEPMYSLLFRFQKDLLAQVKALKKQGSVEKSTSSHPNIFQELINSDLPTEEKADARLQDEAQIVVGAGISTTGWVLSIAAFYIINNPKIFNTLRTELETAQPDPSVQVDLVKLEQLPYLTACLKEAIRMSYGISGRTPRLAPNPITYKNYTIPARTAVGMTLVDINDNEDIFPLPYTYNPDRWLNSPKTKTGENLDKYFVSFLKGNRSCLGINLAWAELYLALSGVFRNFEFELYETDASDVRLAHDFMVPSPKLDSKGVRVKVKKCLISSKTTT